MTAVGFEILTVQVLSGATTGDTAAPALALAGLKFFAVAQGPSTNPVSISSVAVNGAVLRVTLSGDPGVSNWNGLVICLQETVFASQADLNTHDALLGGAGHSGAATHIASLTGDTHTTLIANATAGANHAVDAAGTGHTTLIANATAGAGVSTALQKAGGQVSVVRADPSSQGDVRTCILPIGNTAAAATSADQVAALQAAASHIELDKMMEFSTDNPLFSVNHTIAGGLLTALTVTNNGPAIAQCRLICKQVHSINR